MADPLLEKFAAGRVMPTSTFNPNISPAAQAAIDADTARRAKAQSAPMPAGVASPAFAAGAAPGVPAPLAMGDARVGHRVSTGVPAPVVATADAPAGVTPAPGTTVRGGIGGSPSLDNPAGVPAYAAGSGAIGVMQARANGGLPTPAPMPPPQQGATPAPLTLAQRASNITDRVMAGIDRMVGKPAPAQPSPEFLATEARFATPAAAPVQNVAAKIASNNY